MLNICIFLQSTSLMVTIQKVRNSFYLHLRNWHCCCIHIFTFFVSSNNLQKYSVTVLMKNYGLPLLMRGRGSLLVHSLNPNLFMTLYCSIIVQVFSWLRLMNMMIMMMMRYFLSIMTIFRDLVLYCPSSFLISFLLPRCLHAKFGINMATLTQTVQI